MTILTQIFLGNLRNLMIFARPIVTVKQAAVSKVPDEGKSEGLLYDYFSGKDGIWFDFMADTGDGGNSSYTVARLLAQPSLKFRFGGSKLMLPRGDFLLIGVILRIQTHQHLLTRGAFLNPLRVPFSLLIGTGQSILPLISQRCHKVCQI